MKRFAMIGLSVLLVGYGAAPAMAQHDHLAQQVQALQAQVQALQAQLAAVRANPVLALGPYVTVDPAAERGLKGPHVIFRGVNVHIESGSGSTVDNTGLGNLVIGYDEDSLGPFDYHTIIDANRTGSHNLVVGAQHQFTGSAAMLGGYQNFASANHVSITGGACNAAGSLFIPFASSCYGPIFGANGASVSGGYGNFASGWLSSVSAGESNRASDQFASVSGGTGNVASAAFASISGGESNTASGGGSSVSGGAHNTASGPGSSVSGGLSNAASGGEASVGGGRANTAAANYQNIN